MTHRNFQNLAVGALVIGLIGSLPACDPKPEPSLVEEPTGPRVLTASDLIDRQKWEEVLQAYPHPDIWEPEVLSQAQGAAEHSLKTTQFALIDTELTQLQEARAELASETIFEKPCLVFRFKKDGVQIALPTPLRIDSPVYFAHSTQSSFKLLTDRHPNEWRAARGIVQQLASEMYQSMNKKELGAPEEEAPKSVPKDPASDLNEERLNSQSRP